MSKKVGILRAILRLDGAKFDKDVKKQKSKISRFASFAKRAFAPLAAAVAAIGTARAIKDTLGNIDAQAKLAHSLGTTVKSMQVMTRAAELAGVGQSQLEQGSKDLYRRLSQAATGTGASAKALDRLKLSASDLMKLPLDERVSTINAAIGKFIPKAEQAAVAGALFGEEGSIAMTRLDPATIAQAAQEVAKFGREISDVEAAKIEKANDALSRLKLVGRGALTDLTIALAPALELVSKKLSSWAPALQGYLGAMSDGFTILKSLVTYVLDSFPKGTKAVSDLFTGYLDTVKWLWASLKGLRALIQQAGSFGVIITHIKAIASELGDRLGLIFKAIGLRISGTFELISGKIVRHFGKIVEYAMTWAERMADVAIGSKDAMLAAFKVLPDAIGSLMYQAANSTIDGVEAMINGVIKRLNSFITKVNGMIGMLPSWAGGDFEGIATLSEVKLDGPDNPFAGSQSVGAAASEAFKGAQGKSDFGAIGHWFSNTSAGLLGSGTASVGISRLFLREAQAPIKAVEDLKTAMDDATAAEADALAQTVDLGSGLEDLSGSATSAGTSLASGVKDAASAAADKLKTLRDGVKGIADELASATLQGKSWGEVFSSALRKVSQTWLSQGLESILLKMSDLGSGGSGNIFGQILSSVFGARAQGGGVRAGQIYQVNENTPRSEWLFSSANGGVLNHGQMTGAVRQAIGGKNSQQQSGLMRIILEDGLKAEILNDAAAQSVEITRAGIQGNNSAVSQAQRRR